MGPAYWEIKVDELRRAGWTVGWTAAILESGSLVHVFDAHRDGGPRYVCRDEDRLAAITALSRTIQRERTSRN